MKDVREHICDFGLSLYQRGLTHGSTGNLSARLPDGNLVVTPTGSCLGRLTPESLSVISPNGMLLSGPKPTKEVPLHQAFYNTRADDGSVAFTLRRHHGLVTTSYAVRDHAAGQGATDTLHRPRKL